MLLHVLSELKNDQKKTYVTGCIRMWGLFALAPEDEKPYPSVSAIGGDEPRWNTLVAFARQDCMDRGWMAEKARNQWRISDLGRQVISKSRERATGGLLDVRHGYLWTPKFKKIMCPTYQPGESDAKRPTGSIYNDTRFSALLDEYLL